MTRQSYWTIALDQLSVDGAPIATLGREAVIDTGTTYLYGSYADVAALWATVPGSGDLSAIHGPSLCRAFLLPPGLTPT